MNWQKIKDECPKAWKEFEIWARENICDGFLASPALLIFEHGLEYLYHRSEHAPFATRWLFDFFDEKGIIINIDSWCKLTIDTFELEWSFEIGRANEMWTDDSEPYGSRTEAEQAAFAKAFEILEQQLSQLSNKEKE